MSVRRFDFVGTLKALETTSQGLGNTNANFEISVFIEFQPKLIFELYMPHGISMFEKP